MRKLVFCIVIFICSVSLAGGAAAVQKVELSGAHSAIKKEKSETALKRLPEAENSTKPTPQMMSEIIYLRAVYYEGKNSGNRE